VIIIGEGGSDPGSPISKWYYLLFDFKGRFEGDRDVSSINFRMPREDKGVRECCRGPAAATRQKP
jgi:hypothetical protein